MIYWKQYRLFPLGLTLLGFLFPAFLCAGFIRSNIGTQTESSYAIAVGDTNNDGYLDIAVTNFGVKGEPMVRVYIGPNFTSSWSSAETVHGRSEGARGVALGDLNNDGYLDIVVGTRVNIPANHILVYRNNKNNTFQLTWKSNENKVGRRVALADFNRDGYLDILVANESPTSATDIYASTTTNATGFKSIYSVAAGPFRIAVAAGDFDNDGRTDFVIGEGAWVDHDVEVYFSDNDSGSKFTSYTMAATKKPYRDVAVGDLDKDGYADIAIAADMGGQIKVFRNNGNRTFSQVWASTKTSNFQAVAFGDYDKDGWLDILAGDLNGVPIVYRSTSTKDGIGFKVAFEGISAATRGAAWGDLNNDGRLDFVLANEAQTNSKYIADSVVSSNAVPSPPTGLLTSPQERLLRFGGLTVLMANLQILSPASLFLASSTSGMPGSAPFQWSRSF